MCTLDESVKRKLIFRIEGLSSGYWELDASLVFPLLWRGKEREHTTLVSCRGLCIVREGNECSNEALHSSALRYNSGMFCGEFAGGLEERMSREIS